MRRIFKDYLSGLGASRIAKGLEADEIKNISRKVKWAESSIRDILKNEKYGGYARLQKQLQQPYIVGSEILAKLQCTM